jgi:hypothetical protein
MSIRQACDRPKNRDVKEEFGMPAEVPDEVTARANEEDDGVDKPLGLLSDAGGFTKKALTKAIVGAACESCRHRYCSDCEQCSVPKQSSDYWICHRCGELNLRVPNGI